MLSEMFPGTNIKFETTDDVFSIFRPMFNMDEGLSLGQICSLTGLNPSTIQNWVKRSYVPHPENKKYFERHLSRILLISSLKDCMNIEDIGELMRLVNGDTDDESDDIISETKLYESFSKVIRKLESKELNHNNINSVIRKALSGLDNIHKEKLIIVLETMVYAYVSGIFTKKTNEYLNQLRNK